MRGVRAPNARAGDEQGNEQGHSQYEHRFGRDERGYERTRESGQHSGAVALVAIRIDGEDGEERHKRELEATHGRGHGAPSAAPTMPPPTQ